MRIAKGWNKSQMARTLKISSQLYGQYENGKNPGSDFFIKWKEIFGTDLTSEIETKISREIDEKIISHIVNEDGSGYQSNDPKDKTIADLAYSTRRLVDNNTQMVNMHREFLDKIFISLGGNVEASSPSPEGGIDKRLGVQQGSSVGRSKTRYMVPKTEKQKDSGGGKGK